ncbi:60S ribosomal protein L13, putative [Theileria annulata]|uniref:60S ribosomal protein L13, putative n=1 Tax=Theileria annulata TaxID=5874 RepID=Q4U9S6_THEAN|nr:60S ribosomal protein L13, putative [Theileria annulata]CAI76427.1 60S ribosomal protein L13, putative [Theileria annulata]|eukprot:XP_953052.1 60S ribosomal protein L13, putative [Theileria annulata]
MGRLASVVAKQLLSGQKVVVVRCEEINVSGSLFRNKLKYQRFLRLKTNTNPARGPFHVRSPSKFFARVVRGMLPHKTKRGNTALKRLKTYEGVPPKYSKVKKHVVTSALRFLKLRPGRRFARLGDVLTKVGWNYDGLVKKLEDRRKERTQEYYKAKTREREKTRKAKLAALAKLPEDSRALLTELSA